VPLPSDQADVVLLRVVSGLGTDEVATIMGKPTGTIRVLQHRALRNLAKLLDRDL
jgi:RNA polymerase sigma-70 factor (ECF subfamily)